MIVGKYSLVCFIYSKRLPSQFTKMHHPWNEEKNNDDENDDYE